MRRQPLLGRLTLACILLGVGLRAGVVLATPDSWFEPVSADDILSRQKLSMLFAGQDLRSPISMFGHTLLVAHDQVPPEPDAVVVEYLGQPESSSLGALGALVSSLDGQFKLSRFLHKAREYDLEDRDLWLYELDTSKVDRKLLVARLKSELARTTRYGFVRQNCSFYVLGLVAEQLGGFRRVITLPVDTVRDLEDAGLVGASVFIPSASRAIEFEARRLTSEERDAARLMLRGYSDVSTSRSSEFRSLVSRMASYRLPRESSPEIRNHLVSLKRDYGVPRPLALRADSPTQKAARNALLQLGVATVSPGLVFAGRLVGRDLTNGVDDILGMSQLEALRIQTMVSRRGISLNELTLFRMESLVPDGWISKGFVRYLDASFYNWSALHSRQEEIVLRFGAGYAIPAGVSASLGAIAFAGGRVYRLSEPSPGLSSGLRFYFQHRLGERVRYRLLYQFDPIDALGFRHHGRLDFVPYEWRSWGLFGTVSVLDEGSRRVFGIAGISLFF